MAFAKKEASAKADVLYIYITRWDKPQHSRQISTKIALFCAKNCLTFYLNFDILKITANPGSNAGFPMNRKTGRGKDMSWDLRALGGAVQLPCGELAWTKPQIFRVLASVEAMRGVVLGGDVLFGNGTYTGSSWQYCLSCEDHYVAFLRENCRGSRRTAEAFIRDFLATRSGEYLFAPVLREGVDAYIHRSTGGLAPGYDCAARSGCGLP